MKLKEIIKMTISEYLNENINRDKSRKALFKDEYGKNIVYDDGNYRIAVDDENDARYITLWHKEIVKGKEYWAKRGYLDAWVSNMNFKNRNGKYLSIRSIEIELKHRNMGYGSKMYKALFDFSANDINGVYSFLPNRVNKKQVPKIYNKLGAVIEDDYQFIEFNN
jgi:ribosomal protein S18 acetylase RimI-like enzyme